MVIDRLVQAVQTLGLEEGFHARFDHQQWGVLAHYLQPELVPRGTILIHYGEQGHSMFLLESGTLQAYVPDATKGRRRISILRPGAVCGELSLFGSAPRMAQVEAMSACSVWCLTRARFEELTQRQPTLAMELMRAAGGVAARRVRLHHERGVPLPC
ncbi:cyclic nucleotide-binding domain-containing protein [Ideonella livida]|uniref:Cyclic nucleotide-binding domain-containing protein n=1 Tax=Ideonella livida TaxID=2707176 RepID=A0A7C9PIC6_9BURK|nr:cyclic nucleotide-binding domain-containing protein [Ideonella livida]NDY91912.1 cyclic nucleotide-binding domain-containing protein [Ideonella livida]